MADLERPLAETGRPVDQGQAEYDPRLFSVSMKTAISIPDPVFEEAEALANRLGMSRSELYAKAVKSYLGEHRREGITEALNRVYAG